MVAGQQAAGSQIQCYTINQSELETSQVERIQVTDHRSKVNRSQGPSESWHLSMCRPQAGKYASVSKLSYFPQIQVIKHFLRHMVYKLYKMCKCNQRGLKIFCLFMPFQPTSFQNLHYDLVYKNIRGLIIASSFLYTGTVCYIMKSTPGNLS